MSRSNRPAGGHRPHKPKATRQPTQAELDDEMVSDTAAVFSCFHETAEDFLSQCRDDLEELDTRVVFGSLAEAIWRDRPDQATDLAAVIHDYLEVQQQYRTALESIEMRLTLLAAKNEHLHIGPIEDLRKVVREHLFPTGEES